MQCSTAFCATPYLARRATVQKNAYWQTAKRTEACAYSWPPVAQSRRQCKLNSEQLSCAIAACFQPVMCNGYYTTWPIKYSATSICAITFAGIIRVEEGFPVLRGWLVVISSRMLQNLGLGSRPPVGELTVLPRSDGWI